MTPRGLEQQPKSPDNQEILKTGYAHSYAPGGKIVTPAPSPIEAIAQAIASLSAEDRAKLASMLSGVKDGNR